MAEAAGLVLGTIPLIFLALDKYQECLEFGRSYAKYAETLMIIRDEVCLQQMLFHKTMETMGLDKPTYMELENCLQDRFPENHVTFMRQIRRMATTIDQLMTKLEVDTNSKSEDILSRAGWEWRRVKRSLSIKERRRMFDELQQSNTILSTLLSKREVPLEDWTPMVRTFVARYNQNDCDAVRIQASDVKMALDACWQCSCLHRTSLDLNWHTNRPTKSPVFSVSLSYNMMNTKWRRARVKIDATGISSSTGNDEQALGPAITNPGLLAVSPPQSSTTKQQARSLFSHLRSRGRSTSPLPPSHVNPVATTPISKSTKQIDSLCRFIQGLDNGGECLGFLPVPGGAKLVYIESVPGDGITEEATLMHLLPPNKPPTHLKLSRRKRLEIAVAAAWTTLLLCDTPWLNHTWGKHELCFFSEDLAASGPPLTSRCVSMMQNCALNIVPPASVGATSLNKLVRNEAIFALGVLLIELGLNRSFEECKRNNGIDTATTNVVDDYDVANSLIEDIFDEVGEPYGNAVQRCIRFAFPGRDTTKNFNHAAFRQCFHNLVVAPIEATLSTVPV